jgi:hypothetical protein
MNEVIFGKNNLVMKRLLNFDTNTYEWRSGRKTKQTLGLVVRQPADAPMIVSNTISGNPVN